MIGRGLRAKRRLQVKQGLVGRKAQLFFRLSGQHLQPALPLQLQGQSPRLHMILHNKNTEESHADSDRTDSDHQAADKQIDKTSAHSFAIPAQGTHGSLCDRV